MTASQYGSKYRYRIQNKCFKTFYTLFNTFHRCIELEMTCRGICGESICRWNASCNQLVCFGLILVNTLLKNVIIMARKRLVYNRGWVKNVIEWNFVFAISQPNGIETSKYPPMILMGVVARIVKFWCIWTKTLYEITEKIESNFLKIKDLLKVKFSSLNATLGKWIEK